LRELESGTISLRAKNKTGNGAGNASTLLSCRRPHAVEVDLADELAVQFLVHLQCSSDAPGKPAPQTRLTPRLIEFLRRNSAAAPKEHLCEPARGVGSDVTAAYFSYTLCSSIPAKRNKITWKIK
jgi:hypothetical protein